MEIKNNEHMKRNVKENTAKNRAYIFTGLIKCPECGCTLKGTTNHHTNPSKKTYIYKRYRCAENRVNNRCSFKKSLYENVLEKMLLDNIEQYLEDAKIESAQIAEANMARFPELDIEDIHEQIDRLNYFWQTGKIRKVESYAIAYAELMEKLEKAKAERTEIAPKDFSKMEGILYAGWREVYNNLDDAYKRAWWRSFVQSIEVTWTTQTKRIDKVNFF